MRYAIIFTVIICAIVFYIIFGHNGVLKYNELVTVRQSYEERLREMEKEIEQKKRELELATKNQEYLEGIIRRELGLQKMGEDVYIIEDNNTKDKAE